MRCEEKERLLRVYREDAQLYSFAVNHLQEASATANNSAYYDLSRLAEDARIQCERSRLALERHTLKHSC